MQLDERIKARLRDVPDFPKPGILFKDITPILADSEFCEELAEAMSNQVKAMNVQAIAAIESRGFLFGMLLAQKLKVPFIPIRKKGKLPWHTLQEEYVLEYGSATIEMHQDAIQLGQGVLVHDDLLATGGTSVAAAKLIQKAGGVVVGFQFLIELEFLEGRKNLQAFSKNISTLAGC